MMAMRFVFVILCLVSGFAVPVFAQTQAPLRVELAEDHVDISTGFNGTRIVLFGTMMTEGADVIVTLRGPEQTVALRRKGRVMGTWMNTKTVEFRRVPSYHDFATTFDSAGLVAADAVLSEHEIGAERLGFYPEDTSEDEAVVETFRNALISSMQRKGFYPLTGSRLQWLTPHFFKVAFELPPSVPTGLYRLETLVVHNNEVLAKEAQTLQVGQVGFNARVYMFAQNYSFLYGVFAAVMALSIGWAAFTFLRRD